VPPLRRHPGRSHERSARRAASFTKPASLRKDSAPQQSSPLKPHNCDQLVRDTREWLAATAWLPRLMPHESEDEWQPLSRASPHRESASRLPPLPLPRNASSASLS